MAGEENKGIDQVSDSEIKDSKIAGTINEAPTTGAVKADNQTIYKDCNFNITSTEEPIQKQEDKTASTSIIAEEELIQIIEPHYQQIIKEINWAYQQTVTLDFISYGGKQADSINELINKIAQIPPKSQGECLPLVKFVIYLCLKLREKTDLEIQELYQSLLKCLENHGIDVELISDIGLKLQEKIENSRPCLLIKISEENDGYNFDSWLITHIHEYDPIQPLGCYRLTEVIEEKGKVKLNRNLKNLPNLLQSLREASYFYWDCSIDTIHVFLPLSLIDYQFDNCILDEEEICPSSLGMEYKLALRFTKRLEDTGSKPVKRWKKKGKKIREERQNCVSETLLSPEYKNLQSLGRKIKRENIIGVLLKRSLTSTKEQRDLCQLFFECGIPVALWVRKSLPSSHNILSQDCCLGEVPQQVKNKREEALDVEELEEHIGKHISLLWDDPKLIPPDFKLGMPLGKVTN